ncbi:MAG: DEAD/DEAH box helicase [Chloroflexota bacterium]
MSFDHLGLTPELLRAVADQGYIEPTPVQAEAIPLVLARRDLLANAQTGTGKTAAFVLPIVQILHATPPADAPASAPPPHVSRNPRAGAHRPVRVLVLAPTRELAIQVEESVRTYGAHRPIRSTTIYGGVGFDPQVRKLRAGTDLVVATPGRLLDHVRQGTIDLGRVEILVLDEADRMLDMGFLPDIRRILDLLPAERQSLLFSATFSDAIRRLAAGFLRDPASVQVAPRNIPTELVTQEVITVDRERKRELLTHLIKSGRIYQALVFTRTKHGANRLAEQLERDGIDAAAIHGNKSQAQRVKALEAFKANKVAILVATDIAARGIDIDALPHVVNFELPMVPEDYVHRIGRTGRAGIDGEAISFVCIDEVRLLRDIEDVLGRRIPASTVDGFEPDPRIRPEPILRRTPLGRPGSGGRPAGSGWQGGANRAPAQGRVPAHGGVPIHGGVSGNGDGSRVPGIDRSEWPGQPGRTGGAGRRPALDRASQPVAGGLRRPDGRPALGSRDPRGAAPRVAAPRVAGSQIGERPWRPNAPMPGERLARAERSTHDGRPAHDERGGRDDRPARDGRAVREERGGRRHEANGAARPVERRHR